MKRILRMSTAGLLSTLVVFASADAGAGPEQSEEQAERLALEGMEKLFRALELFIESIPQYEMPEVTEDGDIIIRRKRRPEGLEPPRRDGEPDSDMDETRT